MTQLSFCMIKSKFQCSCRNTHLGLQKCIFHASHAQAHDFSKHANIQKLERSPGKCMWTKMSKWAATCDFQQCGMCDQQSLRSAQSDHILCSSLEYSLTVKLLTEHHLEFLSLKRGCTSSCESTLVKMPHCWKSHVTAQICYLMPGITFDFWYPQIDPFMSPMSLDSIDNVIADVACMLHFVEAS